MKRWWPSFTKPVRVWKRGSFLMTMSIPMKGFFYFKTEIFFLFLDLNMVFWHQGVKIIFSESDSGIVEVSLKRKIPTSFSCSNVDGTQCRKEWNFFLLKLRNFYFFMTWFIFNFFANALFCLIFQKFIFTFITVFQRTWRSYFGNTSWCTSLRVSMLKIYFLKNNEKKC